MRDVDRQPGPCRAGNSSAGRGLIDRREDNGQTKADGLYADTVAWILVSSPQGLFSIARPTWTRQLLIDTAKRYTSVVISRTTMGRLLGKMKVRRGPSQARSTMPVERKCEKTAGGDASRPDRHAANERVGGVGRRGGSGPEPQDRLGLDACPARNGM